MKAILLLSGLLAVLPALRAEDKVIVHEWGTFTSLQDGNGQLIGGINVDDEPAPPFVHLAGGIPVVSPSSGDGLFGLPPYGRLEEEGGALPFGNPAVTLRLETPVIYFYPPAGKAAASVPKLNVHVDFHGGILGQYYPYAKMKGAPRKTDVLTENTISSLDWTGVRLGTKQEAISTTDKVWTTPREVSAPMLAADSPGHTDAKGVRHYTEAEKFLFYRGLGHLASPLTVRRSESVPGEVRVSSMLRFKSVEERDKPQPVWLVEIRPGGLCAFRHVTEHIRKELIETHSDILDPPISSSFTDGDFSADNLGKLQASMQEQLVGEGLYPDEASAMLRTWELSYFKSPGLRFFYIVPRKWVDEVLPLKITGAPTEITRVMIGRIELVTDAQKLALKRLDDGPCPDVAAVKKSALDAIQKDKNLSEEDRRAFLRGNRPLRELGISIPPLVQDYLDLGRFRDALVMDQFFQGHRLSPALAQFIKENQIGPPNLVGHGLFDQRPLRASMQEEVWHAR